MKINDKKEGECRETMEVERGNERIPLATESRTQLTKFLGAGIGLSLEEAWRC